MSARREDWPERLLAATEAARETPFQWGQHDCALMAADLVLAMTDTDFAAPFRGTYSTAFGAARALLLQGAPDLAAYVGRLFGAPIAPGLARRGDLVMFDAADGPALGVVLGGEAAAAGPEGVTWVQRAQWTLAWRVG